MRLVRYNESMLDTCAEFWWELYEDMPYSHRPDGHQTINLLSIGWPSPEYFIKTIKDGFDGAWYWQGGHITDDDIILVEDEGKIAGILVCMIDEEKRTGNILSCYVQRNQRGREIADMLLNEALDRFREMGLRRAEAAPGASRSMEVESPIHIAVLDAGFGWGIWSNDWQSVCVGEQYGVFLGGSLEGFRLQPEIKEKIDRLREEGIVIERVTGEKFRKIRRYDTGEKVHPYESDVNFAALVDGLAVGWLSACGTWDGDPPGVIAGETIPEVIPIYQRKGLGKVLYHLGTEEIVQQGAVCGWIATGIYNPARLIYRSIGYKYWYTCFSRMSKRLR